MKEKLKQIWSYTQTKIILAIVCIFVLIVAAVNVYYSDKFYPNTTLNGIDVSNKTYEQSIITIDDFMENYKADIEGRNDGSYTLTLSDVDFSSDYKDALKATLENEHEGFTLYKIFNSEDLNVDFNVSLDQKKLKSNLKKSLFVKETDDYPITEPIDAHVEYNEKAGYGKIVKEDQGNTVIKDSFYSYVEQEIKNLSTTINLDDGDVYEKPTYVSKDKEVKEQLETYNMYLLKWISWDMGEDTYETMTPEDIKDWLYITDKAKVKIDKDKMAEWIETFCLKYKTVGTTRDFTTHSGEKIQISGGDYGWRLNYSETVDQAYDEIKKETKTSLIEAYQEDQSKANKEALSVTLEPIYENTAYKKDYVDFQNDWDTQNYSEVDISQQMVYVFQNGKQVYSCRCVTGLAGDSSRATKTGVYYIKDKKRYYTLVGDDYSTPTQYWVRIMWTGTGYHYMNRSDWGRWSPSLYKSKGSHGCVNLEYNSAKTIYGLVNIDDPVFIHQ